jgi:Raf kinase inhibitor-like YbhB/YbcL family protein
MQIKSPAFKEGGSIPSRYACDGENINPPLEIIDIPQNAKTLALIMDDPDAPNMTWVHWLIWNIPVTDSSIQEGEPPKNAIYGTNDFGKLEYGGPCPPSGIHRYFFKVYALDKEIDLKEGSTKKELLEEIDGHVIETTQLIGLYSRK